ncbi:MAG: hypothetical protein RLZZ144_494 [Pseudomonadota bacterium]
MKKQSGFNFLKFVLVLALFLFVVVLAIKTIPTYIEYGKLVHVFKTVAANPDLKNAHDFTILESVKKGLALDDIKVVTEQQVDIIRDNGNFELDADYSVKVKAIGNISLLLEFHPSSAK